MTHKPANVDDECLEPCPTISNPWQVHNRGRKLEVNWMWELFVVLQNPN